MSIIKIKTKPNNLFSLLFFFIYYHYNLRQAQAQVPTTTGYPCTPNQTTYPCQTYVFYRPSSPDFLDLASIGDLFSTSRLMISQPSNISSPAAPLLPTQSLFVPITCGCNRVNSTTPSISFANLTYTIKPADGFWFVSTNHFQNLTTYQSVEYVNPTLVPTNLSIGSQAFFPIFCKCPNPTQRQNRENILISYVFQPSDTLASVAARFGTRPQNITDINGNNIRPFDTLFVPVSRLPQLSQPNNTNATTAAPAPAPAPAPAGRKERKGVIIGLAIGLGICGVLLILVTGLWGFREALLKKRITEVEEREGQERQQFGDKEKGLWKRVEVNLLADISDCLDKYRLFGIEELREATDDFDDNCLIQGSVYKGCINGELYAIKKMKWNAREELKILQKVNHGNLVRLEGFCIEPEEASCYLVYEYVESGSLHSWLHGKPSEKLNWKTRLRIAVDVANGLQYIHEHTRPRVVHKDIKSSNILLDAYMRAKIANFGLAKTGCNAITMHIVGTQGYIAPEYLADGVVSTRMDVFSFGVVLLELISGREAVDEDGMVLSTSIGKIVEEKVEEEEKVKRLKEWMDGSLLSESCSIEGVMNVMEVAAACLQKDPSKRPSMVDVVYALCKSDDFLFDVSEDGLSPRQLVAR